MELFESGQIAVPEIQRDVVWYPDQVKDLIHSIFSDYPCGSLIIWEPRQKDEKLMKEIIRPERLAFYKNQPPRYFLIDGQQRITTLASVMLEPGFLKKVEPTIEEDLPSLYVNLRRFPKEIEATSDSDASNFPSSVLMNDLFLGRFRDRPEYSTKLSASQRTEIDKKHSTFQRLPVPRSNHTRTRLPDRRKNICPCEFSRYAAHRRRDSHGDNHSVLERTIKRATRLSQRAERSRL